VPDRASVEGAGERVREIHMVFAANSGWLMTIRAGKNAETRWGRPASGLVGYTGAMDVKRAIADIERLERMFAVPDTRPLNPSDLAAANQKHDERLAHSPWFRLWQHFGVCCRPEAPELHTPKAETWPLGVGANPSPQPEATLLPRRMLSPFSLALCATMSSSTM